MRLRKYGWLIAVPLLLASRVHADEERAVAALQKAGATKITRDDKLPGKPVVGVRFVGWLDSILFNRPRLTDASLKDLKGLPQLQELVLAETQVSDVGLKELKDLKSLRTLQLGGT